MAPRPSHLRPMPSWPTTSVGPDGTATPRRHSCARPRPPTRSSHSTRQPITSDQRWRSDTRSPAPSRSDSVSWRPSAATTPRLSEPCDPQPVTCPAPTEQARLELDIARIHERRGNWDQAEQHLQQGLDHLRDEPTAAQPDRAPLEARLHAELALTAHRQNDANEARRRGEHALDLAQSAGDPWATARAHNTLGMVLRADESFDQAVEHLQQARQLADHLDDPAASVAALNNLALTHADRGDRSRALELAKTALARCRRRGDRHREAALLNNLADLLHAADRPDEARTHIAEAVSLFADIDRPNHLEPEIWKLVDW
jgi:tetratricopeptide (TPR) repeat protein